VHLCLHVCLGMMRRDEVDQRALDGLRGLSVDGGLSVLAELKGSSLQSVSNKSAYMCGIMKSLRQKAAAGILTENVKRPGPDEAKLKVSSALTVCVLVCVALSRLTLINLGFFGGRTTILKLLNFCQH